MSHVLAHLLVVLCVKVFMWMKHFVPPEETILPLRIDQKGAEGESLREGRTRLLPEEEDDNFRIILAGDCVLRSLLL